jgi:hypothetical protein
MTKEKAPAPVARSSAPIIELGDDNDSFDDILECPIDLCERGNPQDLSRAEDAPCGADGHCYPNDGRESGSETAAYLSAGTSELPAAAPR